jgi:hypothetical protein
MKASEQPARTSVRSASSEWFEIGGVRRPELPLDTFIDLFNRALAFYDAFTREYETQRGSYQANKVVAGPHQRRTAPRTRCLDSA